MRYCQELCSEEYGSGGVSELENSVGEDLPFEEGEDQGGGIEFAPVLGRGLGTLNIMTRLACLVPFPLLRR